MKYNLLFWAGFDIYVVVFHSINEVFSAIFIILAIMCFGLSIFLFYKEFKNKQLPISEE